MLFPLLLLMFLISVMPLSSAGNLKSIHVVFRHGESKPKTPAFYPSYPEASPDFILHAHADLTETGRNHSYEFGQYLRSRYDEILYKEYRRADVYARSTYLEQARGSLLCVLAGLYPTEPQQKWHPGLKCQPIPIKFPNKDDPLMWPIDCPAYRHERKRLEIDPKYMDHIKDLIGACVNMERRIKKMTVVDPSQFTQEDMFNFRYTKLWANVDADASILNKITDDFSNVSVTLVEQAVMVRYLMQNHNARLKRLNGGMMLKKILDDMKAVIEGKKMPKINLYAGQEFNLVALLKALNPWWMALVPSYSSAVIVELREERGIHYIKVLYHDGLTGKTENPEIDGCNTTRCPFDELVDVLRENEVLPNDVNECYECSGDDSGEHCFKKDLGES